MYININIKSHIKNLTLDDFFGNLNNPKGIKMINPYSFFDIIKYERSQYLRVEMANLALHLFYDDKEFPFDVSRLKKMTPVSSSICVAVIAWTISNQKNSNKKTSYKIGGSEILTKNRKIWLELILAGEQPNSNPNLFF